MRRSEEFMKEVIINLALFAALCLVFSTFTSCTGTQADNNNLTTKQGTGSKSSEFPPVASAIAEGEIHLLDGTLTKLSEHKGKVVILNLWGIWCPPCRDEMPHLAAMQRQYGEKGFEVIGLNVGDRDGRAESVDAIKRFAAESKIDYTLARIESTMINQFYLVTKQSAVPQSFLVDREGHLRGVFVGGGQRVYDQMQQAVDGIMNE